MEDDGKKVHVPTESGYYDLHFEGSGKFAPKEGDGESHPDGYGEKKDESVKSESGEPISDEYDLEDLVSGFDDEYDLDGFVSDLDDEIDIYENAKNSCTLKNYEKTRNARVEKWSKSFSLKVELAWQKKMREIMDNSNVIARIQFEDLFSLIESDEYKNQFGVGHSEGYDASGATDGGYRGEMTKTCFGTEIKGTTIEQRKKWEKYGTWCPKGDFNSIFDIEDGASQYGSCAVVFKMSKLKGRVTYTIGDSLSFGSKNPIRVEDTPDEFCIDGYNRGYFNLDNIESAKTFNDIVRIAGVSYGESQIHVDELKLSEYASAIAVPHSYIKSNPEKIKKCLIKMSEKMPGVRMVSRTKSGRVKSLKLNDSGEIEWEYEEYEMES